MSDENRSESVDVADAVAAEPAVCEQTPGKPVEKVLIIDIGGTKVKFLIAGETEPRKFASGKHLTPQEMIDRVKQETKRQEFEAVSIGYPGLVSRNGPHSEPGNLGRGWVGFDFAAAFGVPVRILNDAAMQALGSYEGGRMLFLGLGTGVGSALITDNMIVTLELGNLMYSRRQTLESTLSRRGLKRLGKDEWRAALTEISAMLLRTFLADYIVIGGGLAENIREVPPGARHGHNLTAFRGGMRLWKLDCVDTLFTESGASSWDSPKGEWRLS